MYSATVLYASTESATADDWQQHGSVPGHGDRPRFNRTPCARKAGRRRDARTAAAAGAATPPRPLRGTGHTEGGTRQHQARAPITRTQSGRNPHMATAPRDDRWGRLRGRGKGARGVDWVVQPEKQYVERVKPPTFGSQPQYRPPPVPFEAPQRTPPEAPAAAEAQDARFDPDRLFASWDVNGDDCLTVLEICWGLRARFRETSEGAEEGGNGAISNAAQTQPKLPLIMYARIMAHLEDITENDMNPEWQFFDTDEFRALVLTPAPEEIDPLNPNARADFIRKFCAPGYLETILPAESLEPAPTSAEPPHAEGGAAAADKAEEESPPEKGRLERVFDSWDADGDGCLSVEEIRAALSSGTGLPQQQPETAESGPGVELSGDAAAKEGGAQLTEAELALMQEYIGRLEMSGENLEWQYLDAEEFQEIVMDNLHAVIHHNVDEKNTDEGTAREAGRVDMDVQ